jgi:hypothetical protein
MNRAFEYWRLLCSKNKKLQLCFAKVGDLGGEKLCTLRAQPFHLPLLPTAAGAAAAKISTTPETTKSASA